MLFRKKLLGECELLFHEMGIIYFYMKLIVFPLDPLVMVLDLIQF